MSSARLYASSVMRSASGIVNGRSTSASIISNTAAFAPSPRASVTTTIALIAGRFRMLRQACRTSSPSVRIRESPAGRDGSDGRSRLTRDGQLRRARAAMPMVPRRQTCRQYQKAARGFDDPARAPCSSCRSPRIISLHAPSPSAFPNSRSANLGGGGWNEVMIRACLRAPARAATGCGGRTGWRPDPPASR